MLRVISHRDQPVTEWRPGNKTRLLASAASGTSKLLVGEQWFEPGAGAPTHRHPDAEEVVVVVAGTGEFWCDGEETTLEADEAIVFPPGSSHGFRAVGNELLHVWAASSAAAKATIYDDDPEVVIFIGGTQGEELDRTRRKSRARDVGFH